MLAEPSLLSANKLANFHMLIRLAENPISSGDDFHGREYARRPEDFAQAISFLASSNLLTQDTFNALHVITTANLASDDIKLVANCFVEMNRLNLLNKGNVHALASRVLSAPLRTMMAQALLARTFDAETVTVSGPSISESSCANQLSDWLQALTSLTQNDFNFMVSSRRPVAQVLHCIHVLKEKTLYSDSNCQALLDSDFNGSDELGEEVTTQELFNRCVLRQCANGIANLDAVIRTQVQDDLITNSCKLFESLREMQDTYEQNPQEFPGKLLRGITLVKNALPTPGHDPMQENVRELMAFADEVKGHPSPLWQAIGLSLSLLCTAIAIALFPVSLGAAAGATVAALSSIGIFAFAGKRTGLSKDCMDLAEAVDHELQVPRMIH